MYLWHFPTMLMLHRLGWLAGDSIGGMFLNIVVVLAVTLLVSTVTYYDRRETRDESRKALPASVALMRRLYVVLAAVVVVVLVAASVTVAWALRSDSLRSVRGPDPETRADRDGADRWLRTRATW